MALMRTQYWDLSSSPPTPLEGPTGHGESVTDMESHLLPMEQARNTSLYGWGVADGLRVTAKRAEPGVTVSPGAALDAAGRLLVLAKGSFAIVDPDVDPTQVQNIPTVPVGAEGVTLGTAGPIGVRLLTLTWREVLGADNPFVLLHAPWLRLLPESGFQDVGEQVVLARVTVNDDDARSVVTIESGPRRAVGASLERLELQVRRTVDTGSELRVEHVAAADLQAREDGSLDLYRVSTVNGTRRLALTVRGDTGRVGIGTSAPSAGLEIDKGSTNESALRLTSSGPGMGSGLELANTSTGARSYGMYSGADGKWHFADHGARVDRIVIDQEGRVTIGPGSIAAQRPLHVEGHEVHSGGPAGGFSFADRNFGGFAEGPGAGERWVWYALDGRARLWSGIDRLTIGLGGEGDALDIPARVRVRQGWDNSAGIWFHQNGPGLRGFVGMADDNQVGFFGTGFGWGLRMNTNDGGIQVNSRHVGVDSSGVTGIIGRGSWMAGWFEGDVAVRGTLHKNGGGFRIDHPLDPANRYLSHSFVESPDMKNFYDGTVVTNEEGAATVRLPDYFEALNRDFRYQLTPINPIGAAHAWVSREIQGHAFRIRTNQPRVKVSWQVTGVRQDAWANDHRINVEEDKPAEALDLYLYPEGHGRPASSNMGQFVADRLAPSPEEEQ
ncbi:hypothetical protein OG883_14145 [Streptomyces sp. NBC_01142]|uniref:hypothetical protein n=1 Tax=Streptomyces sp. NBC_01142 TaxID=2975865 RepID=UPI0022554595|nr:hypothetical protein [Streptomyces sp. NBC_01142]MCX4821034.1 hypothetical protein [Streptomyces sp. NBC_01142]